MWNCFIFFLPSSAVDDGSAHTPLTHTDHHVDAVTPPTSNPPLTKSTRQHRASVSVPSTPGKTQCTVILIYSVAMQLHNVLIDQWWPLCSRNKP